MSHVGKLRRPVRKRPGYPGADGQGKHYTLSGIDQLAPDLKRIIDEALFGFVWIRPGLHLIHRCMCAISALMALAQLRLLRRHIERSLNLGLTPEQVVEVFRHHTFYAGVPAVKAGMSTTKDIFEEQGIQFTPNLYVRHHRTSGRPALSGAQKLRRTHR